MFLVSCSNTVIIALYSDLYSHGVLHIIKNQSTYLIETKLATTDLLSSVHLCNRHLYGTFPQFNWTLQFQPYQWNIVIMINMHLTILSIFEIQNELKWLVRQHRPNTIHSTTLLKEHTCATGISGTKLCCSTMLFWCVIYSTKC